MAGAGGGHVQLWEEQENFQSAQHACLPPLAQPLRQLAPVESPSGEQVLRGPGIQKMVMRPKHSVERNTLKTVQNSVMQSCYNTMLFSFACRLLVAAHGLFHWSVLD
jgi:hypothetical protein